MARLPIPGSDSNTWGTVLNDFLSVEHNSDGSLKPSGTLSAKADDANVVHTSGSETIAGVKTFTTSPLVPNPTTATQVANKTYIDTNAITPLGTKVTKGDLVYNVKDYGALGNGTADDTSAIQAAISASTTGSTIYFPGGTYLISATISLAPYRKYLGSSYAGTSIQQKNGANIAGALLASYGWINNETFTGNPIQIESLDINGNKANNSSSTASGIVMMNWNSTISNCHVSYTPRTGIRITSANSANGFISNSQVENRIENCKITDPGQHGIWVDDVTANRNTDGFIRDCIVQTPAASGIVVDRSAGWMVDGNHVYTCGASGIICSNAYATRINNNYIEQFGLAYDSSNPYAQGISTSTGGDRGVTVLNNQIYNTSGAHASNTLQYLSATGTTNPSFATIGYNFIQGLGSNSHIGLVMQTSGGGIIYSRATENQTSYFLSSKNDYIGPGVVLNDARVYGTTSTRPYSGSTDDMEQWYRDSGTSTPLAKVTYSGRVDASAGDGLTTKVKAGVPTDADFIATPPNGTLVGDTTNNRLYIRLGGVWRSVTLT